MPQIMALEEENTHFNVQLAELNKQHAVLKEENRKEKAVYNEVATQVKNDKLAVLNTLQDIEKLKSQIVRSPEKLQRVIFMLCVRS